MRTVPQRLAIRCPALIATALAAALMAVSPAWSQQVGNGRLKVVASFSILADLVKNVGGERVDVAALVGPNGNAHVYAPSPADAKKVADARIVFVNGLGFEGWLDRLVKASATTAPIIVASRGVKPLERAGAHAQRAASTAMRIRMPGNPSPTPGSMSRTSVTH